MSTIEQLQAQVEELRRTVERQQREILALQRMRVAEESGGGRLYVGADDSVLRLTALAQTSAQT